MFHCLVFFGIVGLFRSDMRLIFNMFWPWFSCGTVCVCPQLPYRGNDVIFWIFPIVPCHAFCMWHWAVGRDLDLSFIWGHHHLSEYMDISRPAEYFIACYTVLMRPNKVETAVHGCNCWLSVWTLSRRCPVKLFYAVSALHHCLLAMKNVFNTWQEKSILRLTFNPGLALLTGFRTTRLGSGTYQNWTV